MKKDCWAVRTRRGFATDNYSDPSNPLKTILFRTRLHAAVWLEENPYWARLGAYPVKVKVSITEV
jgi:hypothetical protein